MEMTRESVPNAPVQQMLFHIDGRTDDEGRQQQGHALDMLQEAVVHDHDQRFAVFFCDLRLFARPGKAFLRNAVFAVAVAAGIKRQQTIPLVQLSGIGAGIGIDRQSFVIADRRINGFEILRAEPAVEIMVAVNDKYALAGAALKFREHRRHVAVLLHGSVFGQIAAKQEEPSVRDGRFAKELTDDRVGFRGQRSDVISAVILLIGILHGHFVRRLRVMQIGRNEERQRRIRSRREQRKRGKHDQRAE